MAAGDSGCFFLVCRRGHRGGPGCLALRDHGFRGLPCPNAPAHPFFSFGSERASICWPVRLEGMPLLHILAFLQNGRLHRPDLPKSWPNSEDVRGRQRETTFLVNLAVLVNRASHSPPWGVRNTWVTGADEMRAVPSSKGRAEDSTGRVRQGSAHQLLWGGRVCSALPCPFGISWPLFACFAKCGVSCLVALFYPPNVAV